MSSLNLTLNKRLDLIQNNNYIDAMTKKQRIQKWAARRAKMVELRKLDPEYWTLARLGKKFVCSPQRICAILKEMKYEKI